MKPEQLKNKILAIRIANLNTKIANKADAIIEKLIFKITLLRRSLLQSLTKSVRTTSVIKKVLRKQITLLKSNLSDFISAEMVDVYIDSISGINSVLSFDGQVAVFNKMPTPVKKELQKIVKSVKLEKKFFITAIEDGFSKIMIEELKADILINVFAGEGSLGIGKKISNAFSIAKYDAETLTRTYIATINNEVAEKAYKKNKDVIKEVEWSATLEVSRKHGKGTCLRCAGLDGSHYKLGAPHPPIPLHPRCRCYLIPVTRSYKELGLNIPEMERSYRAFSERDKKRVKKGGVHTGDFESFIFSRSAKYQKDFFGKNRYELLKDGTIKFDDLIDKKGNVVLLKQNKNNEYVGLRN